MTQTVPDISPLMPMHQDPLPGADPECEVRGGANGLENLESGEEGGICKNIRLF